MREIRQSIFMIRIWQSEGRISNYQSDEIIQGNVSIHSRSAVCPETRQTTVEVARRLGHPSSYGLLGAEFTHEPRETVTVEVCLSNELYGQTAPYDSLAAGSDSVRAGLPVEYGNTVLQTGLLYASALGPGTLRFSDAAHGLVGSSIVVFDWLTRIVLGLLARDVASMSDDELIAIVGTAWQDTLAAR